MEAELTMISTFERLIFTTNFPPLSTAFLFGRHLGLCVVWGMLERTTELEMGDLENLKRTSASAMRDEEI